MDIKPCPFCGKAPGKPFDNLRDNPEDEDEIITCMTIHHECSALGGSQLWAEGENDEECIAAWNVRHETAQSTLITELVGALENAQQYIPIVAVECRGDKCREPWCVSCFGEDDAAKAIEAAGNHRRAITEALTKAKDQTNDR